MAKKSTVKKAAAKPVKEAVVAQVEEVKVEVVEEVKAEAAEEVKAEVVEEVKKAPAKKTAAKKTTKKAETTEETKKAPAKRAAAKKEVKANVVLQFAGQEADMAVVVENAKKAFVEAGHKESEIKDFQIYVKPEEYAAYYVINQEFTGKVYLF